MKRIKATQKPKPACIAARKPAPRPAQPAADASAVIAPNPDPAPPPPAGPATASDAARRVFRLTYANNQPQEKPKLFRCRDGIAFDEINAAFSNATDVKYSYEMAINLYPNDPRKLTEGYPGFLPSDVIVLTTRPPLDDPSKPDRPESPPGSKAKSAAKSGAEPAVKVASAAKSAPESAPKPGAAAKAKLKEPRKIIRRNNGPLEQEIFKVCRKYLKTCDRKFVTLSERAMPLLGSIENQQTWGDLEFFENNQSDEKTAPGVNPSQRAFWAAVIKERHMEHHQKLETDPDRPSTVAYLIRDELPAIGCDVLVSFGMDGYCTLIWNHIVRRKYPHLITKRGFVMAELVFKELQDAKARPPITIAFADRIVDVNILAEAGPLP